MFYQVLLILKQFWRSYARKSHWSGINRVSANQRSCQTADRSIYVFILLCHQLITAMLDLWSLIGRNASQEKIPMTNSKKKITTYWHIATSNTSVTASSTDLLPASERKVQRTSDRRGKILSKFADSRLHEPGQKQTQLEITGVDVTLENDHPRLTLVCWHTQTKLQSFL